MKVALGTFACFCIEARFGGDLYGGVQAVLRSYARSLHSATSPIALPAFCLDPSPEPCEEFDVPVEPEIETVLRAEARKQAVGIQQLLAHAVFVHIASLDTSPVPGPPAPG
jgi:hypothetical protein